jgi:hypothetical protein
MFESSTSNGDDLKTGVQVMLVVWCILMALGLIPGLMATGMAFEGGHTLDAYLGLAAIWSYPPLVAIAFFFRRRKTVLIWLPLLTVLLFAVEQLVWKAGFQIKFSD